jgi:hypothetical protein
MVIFCALDYLLQCRGVFGKRIPAFSRSENKRLRFAGDERLLNLNVTGLFEPIEMRTEIAVGQFQQLAQSGEVDALTLIQTYERRHDLQPNRLVNDIIKLRHFSPPSYAYVQTGPQKSSASHYRHPKAIIRGQKIETHQRHARHGKPKYDHEGASEPKTHYDIGKHGCCADKRVALHAAKRSQQKQPDHDVDKQQNPQCGDAPAETFGRIVSKRGLGMEEPADDSGSHAPDDSHRDEYLPGVRDVEMGGCICDDPKYTPQYQYGIRISRRDSSPGLNHDILNGR